MYSLDMAYNYGRVYAGDYYLNLVAQQFNVQGYSYVQAEAIPRAADLPAPYCSCGNFACSGKVTDHGFCESKERKFWDKVRKLYWHRVQKNESLITI